MSHCPTNSEILFIQHSVSHNVLIAALKNGCFVVWDLPGWTLAAYHTPTSKKSSTLDSLLPTTFCLSFLKPTAFYSRIGSNIVETFEFFSTSKTKVEFIHKKPVTSLACHPSKDFLAVGCADGTIRIWATDTNISKVILDGNDMSDDKKKRKLTTSPITCLAFHSKKDLLVSGSQHGRVILWSLTNILSPPSSNSSASSDNTASNNLDKKSSKIVGL